MRPETVAIYIGRYLHDLSIPASGHQLRHWFGTTVDARSEDLRVPQELLGHVSPETTAIYVGWSSRGSASVVQGLRVG
jgi:site-specific recombinase XerD